MVTERALQRNKQRRNQAPNRFFQYLPPPTVSCCSAILSVCLSIYLSVDHGHRWWWVVSWRLIVWWILCSQWMIC